MLLRIFSMSVAIALGVLSAGCSGGGGNTVTGTVTFNNQPLERGQITFMPADGKGTPVGGAISGGKFTVSKVPTGKCKVLVASALSNTPAPDSMGDAIKDKDKDKKKDATVEVMPADEGNSKEHDIPSGGTNLAIAIRTSHSSGAPPKK